MKVTKWALEAMLLRWSETSNGGATIVLQLADVAHLEPFKALTLAKGKQAGQRLGCAFCVIGDDEKMEPVDVRQPAHAKFPGGLTGLAVRWCADEHFWDWLYAHGPTLAMYPEPSTADGHDGYDEKWAKAYVCAVCEIDSRKELETDSHAAAIFKEKILAPYHEYRANNPPTDGE